MKKTILALLLACSSSFAQDYSTIQPNMNTLGAMPSVQNQISQQDVISACINDYNTFCSQVLPGGGRIVSCLLAVQDQISQGCKNAALTYKAQNPNIQNGNY